MIAHAKRLKSSTPSPENTAVSPSTNAAACKPGSAIKYTINPNSATTMCRSKIFQKLFLYPVLTEDANVLPSAYSLRAASNVIALPAESSRDVNRNATYTSTLK